MSEINLNSGYYNSISKSKTKERETPDLTDFDRKKQIEKDYKDQYKVKLGRNDLCPCGSGKKYKKCCGK